MAYGTGDIVYGVPLVELPGDITLSEETEECKEGGDETQGFICRFSGGHEESPAAFGLNMHVGLSSIEAFTVLDPSGLTITDDHRTRYAELIDALPEKVREDIQALGEPKLFVLWSTS